MPSTSYIFTQRSSRKNSAIASLLNLPHVVTPNGGYSRAILQGRNRWFKTLWMRFREQPHVRWGGNLARRKRS